MPVAKHQVLVVDDDDSVRRLMVQALSRRHELQLDEADSKAAALVMVERSRYDLVLTDIRMEEPTTGLDLLRAIKERSPSTAVILITGYGVLGTAIDAIRDGADDYLLKPLSLAELDASVARALERRAASVEQRSTLEQAVAMLQTLATDAGPVDEYKPVEKPTDAPTRVLRSGSIALDTELHRATVDGERIDLTPTELTILRELLSADGRLVSFENLVAATHQLEATRDDARELLASHIRNLRRKLGNSAWQLVNVRGIGYFIESADN